MNRCEACGAPLKDIKCECCESISTKLQEYTVQVDMKPLVKAIEKVNYRLDRQQHLLTEKRNQDNGQLKEKIGIKREQPIKKENQLVRQQHLLTEKRNQDNGQLKEKIGIKREQPIKKENQLVRQQHLITEKRNQDNGQLKEKIGIKREQPIKKENQLVGIQKVITKNKSVQPALIRLQKEQIEK